MSAELMQMLMGFRTSQAIQVAATLRVPDLLADGPRSSAELAGPAGADGPALHRLLRALAAIGVFHEDDDGRFSLTPLSERLRSDVSGSVRGWALLIARPYFWRSWGNLEHSIRTGENAFRALHGTDVWDWRSREPEESEIFDGAMKAMTGAANEAILDAYALGHFATIGPPNEGAEGKFSDLNMLVMQGGRERTEAEFASLFERVGLRLVRTVPSAAGPAVLEASA